MPRPPLRHMSTIERLPLTHGATFGPRHYCVSKGVGRSTKLSLYVNLSFLCTLQAWSNIVRVSRRLTRVSAFGKNSGVCPKLAMNASSFASAAACTEGRNWHARAKLGIRSTSSQDLFRFLLRQSQTNPHSVVRCIIPSSKAL